MTSLDAEACSPACGKDRRQPRQQSTFVARPQATGNSVSNDAWAESSDRSRIKLRHFKKQAKVLFRGVQDRDRDALSQLASTRIFPMNYDPQISSW
jgi:hypothetical protein